jgi:16S rRNA (cytidine1402-2'-O)-methyltransferase
LKCVDELITHFGAQRQASFVKEISKLFEKHIHGNLEEIKIQLQSEKIVGEWVICLEGIKD